MEPSKSTDKLVAIQGIIGAIPADKLQKTKAIKLDWKAVETHRETVLLPTLIIEFED